MELERKPTQQDVSWFLDLNNNNQLDLSPSYQRKSVWNSKDQEFYLDTIINNYPCPAIFLHKDIANNGKTIYRVIDGKQRLTTIINFSENLIAISNTNDNDDIRGLYFKDLEIEYKKKFWNYALPVELVNTDNSEIIKSIFDRLNRNNMKLERQELRNARYDGKLFQYVENESLKDFWTNYIKFTKKDIARMEDQQFISELVLVILKDNPQGFEQDNLDELYSQYDIEFEEEATVSDYFEKIKNFIEEINNFNNVIKKYFSTRAGFYTLWSAIYKNIEDLPDVQKFSNKLIELGEKIKNPEDILPTDKLALNYVKNNRGATTDKTPRLNRHEVILEIIRSLKI